MENTSTEKKRKIFARLHRLEGQIRSIEKLIESDNYDNAITQLEAVIAASKSSLIEYLGYLITETGLLTEVEKWHLVKRFLRRN